MKKINIFIELTRLNKPIGIMLLFWPCAWGLTLGNYFSKEMSSELGSFLRTNSGNYSFSFIEGLSDG